MSKTLAQFKEGVAGLLSGTNLYNVTNLNRALERGLANFLTKASVPEASNEFKVTLYSGIYDYLAPSDIFGSIFRDFRQIGAVRSPDDYVYKQYIDQFDRNKTYVFNGVAITFETRNGINVMRVKQNKTIPSVLIDPMSDDTDWTVGGSASSIGTDRSNYYAPSASLRFTLTGASSGYIEKTLDNSIDMSNYENLGVAFLELNIPTAKLTSVTLRAGSDNANYYSVTQTQGNLGAWTTGDFLDTPFDLSTASKTGSPDMSAVKYVRLTFVTTDTITNIRCGNLFASLPANHKMIYTTNAIFSQDGVLSNTIKNDTDVIMLNDQAMNIFEHECAISIAIQNGGALGSGKVAQLNGVLNGTYNARTGRVMVPGLYEYYRASNPSDEIKKGGNWYY